MSDDDLNGDENEDVFAAHWTHEFLDDQESEVLAELAESLGIDHYEKAWDEVEDELLAGQNGTTVGFERTQRHG